MSDTDLTRRNLMTAVAVGGAATLLGGNTLFGQMAAGGGGAKLPQKLADYLKPSNLFADGEWKLPALPYDAKALEPHIDAQTMTIHHDKHHKAYVDNLNKAVKKLADAKDMEPGAVEALQRDLSFNLGGHMLHTMFWAIMGPGEDGKMGGEPTGKVAELIQTQFGGFAAFKSYFTKVATTIKGSGWGLLLYSPISETLVTSALKDQDSTHPPGTMPVLGIDVWEHAYYLKYQNDRAKYVEAWFNTINWSAVNALIAVHSMKM